MGAPARLGPPPVPPLPLLLLVQLLLPPPLGADPQCSLLLDPQRMLVPFGEAGHRASCAPAPGQAGRLASLHWRAGGATLAGDTWSADGLTDWEAAPLCSASFTGPRATCQRALDLTLYKSPDDVSVRPPPSAAWLENTRVTLHCDIVNVAPARNLTVRWYRGNQTMTSEVVESLRVTGCRPDARCLPERVRTPLNVTSAFSLTLSRELSGAQLRCEAELLLAGARRRLRTSSAPLNLTVYYKPSIKSENQASAVPLFHGHPELLRCEADGAPPPQIRWLFEPELRPNLTARGLLVSQPGLYTCNATNAAGSASRRVEVLHKVDYLPLIAGFVAVTVVIISVIFVFIYSIYYKNTKMRRYSVKNPKLGAHQGNVAHNGWELQLPVTRLA